MTTVIKETSKKISKISAKHRSFNSLWKDLANNYSNQIAIIDDYNNNKFTYNELYNEILRFSAGLNKLGLEQGDHFSLFSENSSKWLIADQAALVSGYVNAVRGSQAPTEELLYILEHSDSKALVVENLKTFNRLKDYKVDFAVCLSNEAISDELKSNYNIYSYDEVIEIGKKEAKISFEINSEDVATLIYTSGTTSKPKGVMLTQANLISQIYNMGEALKFDSGKTALNILPTWHVYERTCEYVLISKGITLNYTNIVNFKADLKRYNPDYLMTVPRLWEAIYNGIQTEIKRQPAIKQKILNFCIKNSLKHIKAKRIANFTCFENIKAPFTKRLSALVTSWFTYTLHNLADKSLYNKLRAIVGNNFDTAISGGGALAGHLEDFFEAIGIKIIVGYGLTETSPVLTLRDNNINPKLSAGIPIPNTQIKIVNPETGKKEDFLTTGVVMVKGPQVMKGYYENPEATSQVLSEDGWFNTGDLGWLTPDNNLILTGRHKDLIVLSNGENIEPQPLEDTCLVSPYINQIMLVGQDKHHLGALISPNLDNIKDWADKKSINYSDSSHIYNCPDACKLLKKEINTLLKKRKGYRPFERINSLKMITEPFTLENGLLTRTMKVKKAEVQKKYDSLIEEMYEN